MNSNLTQNTQPAIMTSSYCIFYISLKKNLILHFDKL